MQKFNPLFECTRAIVYQALAQVFCHEKHSKNIISVEVLSKNHFGEFRDNTLGPDSKYLKFGFKGAIVSLVNVNINSIRRSLIFANLHLSSKKLIARRRHFATILSDIFKNIYK